MNNETQLERYKKLVTYIDENYKEDINIETVEAVCHYSYRNINRIFQAIHKETTGKYVKRIRLEKAAAYLIYSEASISDISYEFGFENLPAFSKAFKKKFNCSPSSFRKDRKSIQLVRQQTVLTKKGTDRQKLQFKIEYLERFEFIFIEYRGSLSDDDAIKRKWEQLVNYALTKQIVTNDSIFMTEVIDDDEISDDINFRLNFSIVLNRPLKFQPNGLFRTKKHEQQKYAKFIHKGSHQSTAATYNEIFTLWMLDVNLEFEDRPILEFYLNDEDDTPTEELLTEIYIAVK